MIEAIGLTKHYGSTIAVDNLSFTVRGGTVTGFLGPNGAGKSTTMRMILGLDNPTSGRALIGGQPYAKLVRPLTQVGALLDANWIHPNRSARAHLRFMAGSNRIPAKRVDEVLDLVGLSSVAKKSAGKFSLGMKQRLGLAGALLGDPKVLLFDEPVNGLDPEGIFWIRNFMRNLAQQGRTVLVSSHLLSEMALTADHLIVIGRGRLIAEASTAEFIARSTKTSVRVRSPQMDDLRTALREAALTFTDSGGAVEVTGAPIEQVGDVAARASVTLHELSPQAGSLEEAFIQLTGDSVEYGTSRAVPGLAGVPAPPSGPVGPVPAGFGPGAPAGVGPGGIGPGGIGPGGIGPGGIGAGGIGPGGIGAAGYPPPPGYGPPGPQGYGPPPGAGTQLYGPPPQVGAAPGHPQGYAPPPGYGQAPGGQQGYGPPPGVGPAPVGQRPDARPAQVQTDSPGQSQPAAAAGPSSPPAPAPSADPQEGAQR